MIDSKATTLRADQACSGVAAEGPPHELRIAGAALAACALALLAFVLLPEACVTSTHWFNAAAHSVLEIVAIVVAGLVFSVGWFTFERHRSSGVALVCNAFLAAAVLDVVHMLSYEGMPGLLTPSGGGKAIVFHLAGHLVVAAALLALALMSWRRPINSAARHGVVALSLAFAATVVALGLLNQEVPRLFLVPGSGLTPLKVGIEWLIIALNVAAAAGYLRQLRRRRRTPAVSLLVAALMLALSELSFTLYVSPLDAFSMLGHVYQLLAYLLIYRALFVGMVRLPYQRLEAARRAVTASEEKLRTLFEHSKELNATLEQRVRERTAELEAANRELEHFAHAVAHDLRAPLAAIAGFGSALAREISPPAARAQHLLERMVAGVGRMEEMIQAMLELSQLSRCVPQREPLDLSALARQVSAACQEGEPARRVEVRIQDGIEVHGDRRLLAVALENLLGNAWKFTAGQPQATVSVGASWVDGELVCTVRDNGPGFDMAQAGKLFGMFQRLHSVAEFPGHGIGLANVRRIVTRHGGRIWAESAPGAGAAFHFTLGPRPPAAP